MSQEKLELLRPVLAEWAEGNFWGAAELMAPDITFRAAPPANFIAQGREEAARQMLDLLAHWSDYRIEAEELEDLGARAPEATLNAGVPRSMPCPLAPVGGWRQMGSSRSGRR